jgi:hypothetical protein
LFKLPDTVAEFESAGLASQELTDIVSDWQSKADEATILYEAASQRPWSIENQEKIIDGLKAFELLMSRGELEVQSMEQKRDHRDLTTMKDDLGLLHDQLVDLHSIGMEATKPSLEDVRKEQEECESLLGGVGAPPWSPSAHELVQERLYLALPVRQLNYLRQSRRFIAGAPQRRRQTMSRLKAATVPISFGRNVHLLAPGYECRSEPFLRPALPSIQNIPSPKTPLQ